MDPVLPQFIREFQRVTLRPPAIPVISNLTGTALTADDATDPTYWTRHLRGTVRLVDGLKALKALSAETVVIEAGPGNTLTRSARAAGFASVEIRPDLTGRDRCRRAGNARWRECPGRSCTRRTARRRQIWKHWRCWP